MDLNFLKYFGDVKQEISLLGSSKLNFNESKIKFGVKNAFYGLHFYSQVPKFKEPKNLMLTCELAELVDRVS